jgi:hypothetical protein
VRTNRPPRTISFIISANDNDVLKANALASPDLRSSRHEVLIKRGFTSAGAAYNSAIKEARHSTMVFLHQDVYLPTNWTRKLDKIITDLDRQSISWGVLGCYGVASGNERFGHVFSNGLNRTLGAAGAPIPCQSLDECLLVLRKRNGLHFDPQLPHFHLYGTDICLQATLEGKTNFAFADFCIHNSLPVGKLPPEFWQCAEYLRRKWVRFLPVKTCCTTIHPSRLWMLWQHLSYNLRKMKTPALRMHRMSNPALRARNLVDSQNQEALAS